MLFTPHLLSPPRSAAWADGLYCDWFTFLRRATADLSSEIALNCSLILRARKLTGAQQRDIFNTVNCYEDFFLGQLLAVPHPNEHHTGLPSLASWQLQGLPLVAFCIRR